MDKKVFLIDKERHPNLISRLTEKDLEEWVAEESYTEDFSIIKIDAEGYSTPEEALKGEGILSPEEYHIISFGFQPRKAMYKVYQLQKENIEETADGMTYDVAMNVIGEYSETKETEECYMLAESVWNACNVSCWDSGWEAMQPVSLDDLTFYPTEKFMGYCNSDIVVETKGGLYVSMFVGFRKVESLEEATYRIIAGFGFIQWERIRDKSNLDEREFKRILETE